MYTHMTHVSLHDTSCVMYTHLTHHVSCTLTSHVSVDVCVCCERCVFAPFDDFERQFCYFRLLDFPRPSTAALYIILRVGTCCVYVHLACTYMLCVRLVWCTYICVSVHTFRRTFSSARTICAPF
eukprot:GHVS01068936.1.p1 GENE.GHVS01068936.1~~GHVS01068936.1.p1  ORF type:complete len:125 (-),score=8.00 GHVS01068936.1:16-390(-)